MPEIKDNCPQPLFGIGDLVRIRDGDDPEIIWKVIDRYIQIKTGRWLYLLDCGLTKTSEWEIHLELLMPL